MSSKNYEKPPAMFEPYASWKLLVELWSDSTDYTAAQQGPILVLNLKGDARDAALSIPKDELKSTNGLKLIMKKLDTLYEKDATQLAYLAFDRFVKYRRPDGVDMDEFLRKFELMKNKCETYKFSIPENILAYFMLSCANLPKDKEDIIRATIKELNVNDMRGQILKVYTELSSNVPASNSNYHNQGIKVEPECSALPVMYASQDPYEYNAPPPHPSHVFYGGYNHNQHHRGNRGRGRGKRGYNKKSYPSQQGYYGKKQNAPLKLNPPDKSGQPSQCGVCKSIYHWEKDCPDNQQRFQQGGGQYSGYYSYAKDDGPL